MSNDKVYSSNEQSIENPRIGEDKVETEEIPQVDDDDISTPNESLVFLRT